MVHHYEYSTINSTIFIMMHHALSHKMIFCSFRRVIWLLTQCFKLISFLHIFLGLMAAVRRLLMAGGDIIGSSNIQWSDYKDEAVAVPDIGVSTHPVC